MLVILIDFTVTTLRIFLETISRKPNLSWTTLRLRWSAQRSCSSRLAASGRPAFLASEGAPAPFEGGSPSLFFFILFTRPAPKEPPGSFLVYFPHLGTQEIGKGAGGGGGPPFSLGFFFKLKMKRYYWPKIR
uniref:Uncharacterized protein n=1 Tax=Morchella brunnea TaxID=1174671 RepID=A0A8K1I818_9PEZI|nr:hypothetical protein LK370_mgp058 [Morchella brunnea]UBU98576.1 hypothetical protein [Morchella brunnea]